MWSSAARSSCDVVLRQSTTAQRLVRLGKSGNGCCSFARRPTPCFFSSSSSSDAATSSSSSSSSLHKRALKALGTTTQQTVAATTPGDAAALAVENNRDTSKTSRAPVGSSTSARDKESSFLNGGIVQSQTPTTSASSGSSSSTTKPWLADNAVNVKEETESVVDTNDDVDIDDDTVGDKVQQRENEAMVVPSSSSSSANHHQYQLHEFAPRIVVVGVGGGGGNAINNMISKELQGVDFLALNTDAQHLSTTLTDQRLQLGVELTRGLGCGANPDAGRMAAEECRPAITELLKDSHMVFITAGMGGGTGTGAAPIVAEICYELDILTVCVVTLPFSFEGTHRKRLALEGIGRLQSVVDTLIVIPNQNLFQLATPDTSFVDAFAMADDVLLGGVKSITDLMTSPGLINLDFADVQSVMHGMGNALLGTGLASGEERATEAALMALDNPLLGSEMDISTAKGMLVNITGGKDMTLFEVDKAAQCVTERVKDESANIIFGSAYDETLEGSVRVSVVATGIDQPPPM